MAQVNRQMHGTSIWAFILIGLGVVWLLFQADVFSGENLVVLFRLWPIVLIAFGLELLFGRNSRSLSLLIGAGTVILLLVLMIAGPALGLAPNVEINERHIEEPLGDTTSAQLDLDLSVGNATVQALTDSNALLDADLRYIGNVQYSASGTQGEKFVRLSTENTSVHIFDFLGLTLVNDVDADRLRWNIGLTPEIPLDLRLHGGVGDSTIDLSGLQLTDLSYENGVGNTTITLPTGDDYDFGMNGGVGSVLVNFPEGAAIMARVEAGVGDITLDVPDNMAVRLTADGGLGEMRLPDFFTQVSGDDDRLDRNGAWETDGFDSAEAQLIIDYSGGVGSLTVR